MWLATTSHTFIPLVSPSPGVPPLCSPKQNSSILRVSQNFYLHVQFVPYHHVFLRLGLTTITIVARTHPIVFLFRLPCIDQYHPRQVFIYRILPHINRSFPYSHHSPFAEIINLFTGKNDILFFLHRRNHHYIHHYHSVIHHLHRSICSHNFYWTVHALNGIRCTFLFLSPLMLQNIGIAYTNCITY